MTVRTPDKEFNSMMNTWSPYNCLITYAWSRAASLVYAGERDGLGYRDTVQDILGVLPAIPDEAGKRLELMITGQVSTGGAMPVVKQFNHHPGREKPPLESEYRSDDCLWLFNTVPAYVKETAGSGFTTGFFPTRTRARIRCSATCGAPSEFSLERSGRHGLPCGLSADWNDCIQLGPKGESVFVAFQLRFALSTYIEICGHLNRRPRPTGRPPFEDPRRQHRAVRLGRQMVFTRIPRDGMTFGSQKNEEGRIFLSPSRGP